MNRRVDDLGRIVVPAEIRKVLGLKEGSTLDIAVENETIILSPRRDSCVFCGSKIDLKDFKKQWVCAACMSELSGSEPPSAPWQPAPGRPVGSINPD